MAVVALIINNELLYLAINHSIIWLFDKIELSSRSISNVTRNRVFNLSTNNNLLFKDLINFIPVAVLRNIFYNFNKSM